MNTINIKLYLDPSIDRTGYCIILQEDSGINKIWKSGVIRSKGSGVDRIKNLIKSLNEILVIPPTIFIIEIPGVFSYTRHTNAYTGRGLNHDALRKNNWVVGALILRAQQLDSAVELVEAHQWKGRMTKKDCVLIASNIAKRKLTDHNEADAICLAAWHCKNSITI